MSALPLGSSGQSAFAGFVVGGSAPALDRMAALEARVALLEARLARYESEEARRVAADETSCSKREAAAILGVSVRELERRMLEPDLARTWFRPPDPKGKTGLGRVRFMRRKLVAYRDGLV